MNHKSSTSMRTRELALEIKSTADDGTFTGYASVFDVVDSYQEVVIAGAFKASLAATKDKGRSLPVLWQHRSGEPIGVWDSLKEDDHGLLGKGALWLDDAPYAKLAYRGMKTKSITGISIGYYIVDSNYNEKTGIRTLKEVDLVECSIVTVPSNDDARIETIKKKLAHGGMPSLPDFERFLREAGFSKTQAAVIANRGLSHLLRSESEGASKSANDLAALIERAGSLTLPTF